MRKIISTILVNIGIFLALIVLLELVLRAVGYAPTDVVRPIYCPNLLGDYAPFQSRRLSFSRDLKNSFITNSQGFRSLHEYPAIKGKDTIRILCLGDSFTLGFGVDDHHTYPEILKNILEKQYPGIHIEVYNAGWLLSNILDAMDYYYEKGYKIQPDIVLLQFYINDIFSDMSRAFVYRNAFRLHQSDCSYNRFVEIFRNTAIFNTATKLYVTFNKNKPRLAGTEATTDPINRWLVRPTEEERRYMDPILSSDEANIGHLSRIWDSYSDALRTLAADIRKNGALPVLFVAPHESQMRDDYNAPYCVLYPLARETGLGFVDMTQTFRSLYNGRHDSLYIPGDEHTNPIGNTAIAATIARHLSLRDEQGQIHCTFTENASPRSCDKKMYRVYNTGGVFHLDDVHGAGGIDAMTAEVSGLMQTPDVAPDGFAFIERNDVGSGGVARLTLHFKLHKPVGLLHALVYWRLLNDAKGASRVVVIADGDGQRQVLLDQTSDGSGDWDGTEQRKVLQGVFARPVDAFTLEFYFYGKSGILMASSPGSTQQRALEISLWPSGM